jgi:hypothetical protein
LLPKLGDHLVLTGAELFHAAWGREVFQESGEVLRQGGSLTAQEAVGPGARSDSRNLFALVLDENEDLGPFRQGLLELVFGGGSLVLAGRSVVLSSLQGFHGLSGNRQSLGELFLQLANGVLLPCKLHRDGDGGRRLSRFLLGFVGSIEPMLDREYRGVSRSQVLEHGREPFCKLSSLLRR